MLATTLRMVGLSSTIRMRAPIGRAIVPKGGTPGKGRRSEQIGEWRPPGRHGAGTGGPLLGELEGREAELRAPVVAQITEDHAPPRPFEEEGGPREAQRSEEHTSELQSRENLVC